MPGNRMSSLPIARYCARAPAISIGAGRAAAMSTAYHARCASAPGVEAMLLRLTPEERETVDSWLPPKDCSAQMGLLLRYEDAEKEVEVALDEHGDSVDASDPRAETVGHIDFAWVCEVSGRRIAYVADLKKSEFTSEVDSLQLIAYGFAWAARHGCDAFCCGIWAATEGTWTWGDIVDLEKSQTLTLWKTVLAAARNTGPDYSTGAHCRGCWARFSCPAHLVGPGAAAELEPLTRELTSADAPKVAELLLRADAAEDAVKAVRSMAKDYAARFGLKDPRSGKEFRPIQCKGKPSLDKDALSDLVGAEVISRCTKQGAPYEQWRWLSPKGA